MIKKSLFSLCISLLCLACDEGIHPTKSPASSLSTNTLVFPNPEYGSSVVLSSVEITNNGEADLVIVSVKVTEVDPQKEIGVLDEDDWNAEVIKLAPNMSKEVQLQWSVRDAIPDQATLTIETNDGAHQVRIETPDLDPSLKVTLKSGEQLPEREGMFSFNQK